MYIDEGTNKLLKNQKKNRHLLEAKIIMDSFDLNSCDLAYLFQNQMVFFNYIPFYILMKTELLKKKYS